MSNFFSENNNNPNPFQSDSLNTQTNDEQKEDDSLKAQYKKIETNYEQIFLEAAESIRKELDTFKPQDACLNCQNKECKIEKKDIFAPYPPTGCKYRDWQLQSLSYLAGEYRQKLKTEYKRIMDKKSEYECNKCGACCKLDVSEYSYEQLKQRAMKGDKYSADFVSVFIPYENEDEARETNPEYFDLLNILVPDEKVYYYHCPKVDCNLCTIYDKRPNICKDFPHNPLKLLPKECSYNAWKNDVAHAAMLLKAKTDIINFYKEKLQ